MRRGITAAIVAALTLVAVPGPALAASEPTCSAAVTAPTSSDLPRFTTPPGGRLVDLTPAPTTFASFDGPQLGERTCRAVRVDGSTAAELVLDRRGRIVTERQYDTTGTLKQEVFSDYEPDPSTKSGDRALRGEPSRTGFRRIKPSYCADWQYAWSGNYWHLAQIPIWWYVNTNSFPDTWNMSNLVDALRAAVIEWNTVSNWCGQPDDNPNLQTSYRGTTTLLRAKDLRSVVSMAPALNCAAGAVACTSNQYSCSGCIVESDIQFLAGANWGMENQGNKMDIWSTMAHEWGHALGFQHVSGWYAVMGGGAGQPTTPLGDLSHRALQGGDAYVVNLIY